MTSGFEFGISRAYGLLDQLQAKDPDHHQLKDEQEMTNVKKAK